MRSLSQTMPSSVPLAEMLIVSPGKPTESLDSEVGLVEKAALTIEKLFTTSLGSA